MAGIVVLRYVDGWGAVVERSRFLEGLGDGGDEEEGIDDADDSQEVHLATVVEILQSIKQADMSPMLSRIYSSEGGTELLDVLMKYLYASSPLYEPPL
jgi:hypothetical protein